MRGNETPPSHHSTQPQRAVKLAGLADPGRVESFMAPHRDVFVKHSTEEFSENESKEVSCPLQSEPGNMCLYCPSETASPSPPGTIDPLSLHSQTCLIGQRTPLTGLSLLLMMTVRITPSGLPFKVHCFHSEFESPKPTSSQNQLSKRPGVQNP